MKPEKIYRAQGYLLSAAAISAIISLSSKAVLAANKHNSAFIQFKYFISNLDRGNIWAYGYWCSSVLFLSALTFALFLEQKKKK